MKNYWKNKKPGAHGLVALLLILVTGYGAACPGQNESSVSTTTGAAPTDTVSVLDPDTIPSAIQKMQFASTQVPPDSIVQFARTLLGIPYLYASTDPLKGFDCSGFITYVFNHFGIKVPRSSVDFTNYGRELPLQAAVPGDLVLFTGTDSTVGIVGHMGIVEHRQGDTLYFIHSSSGKANGVVISPLGKYYSSRFVKAIRVFPDSLFQLTSR